MMSRRAGKMSDSSEAIGLGWFIKSRKTFVSTFLLDCYLSNSLILNFLALSFIAKIGLII